MGSRAGLAEVTVSGSLTPRGLRSLTAGASLASALASLGVSWALAAALAANMPMIPLCCCGGPLAAGGPCPLMVLAAPGSRWPWALCGAAGASGGVLGTAAAQRMALNLRGGVKNPISLSNSAAFTSPSPPPAEPRGLPSPVMEKGAI